MFAVLGAVLVWKVATAPAEYTGTNSVGVRSIVATLQPGQRMCVPGLSIPRDTGRVRFQLAARSARQRFDGRLTAVGHSYPTTAVVGQPRGALTDLDFAIPTAGAGHSAPATFCFRPVGGSAVDVGGMAAHQGNQEPPRIDGKVQDARVDVVFLVPANQHPKVGARLHTVFNRAATLRPGFVGGWTYALLLLVVLPLLLFASVRVLARAAGTATRRTVVAIGLLAFLNAAAWALITPSFGAPDEQDHFAYGQYLAETGHRPASYPTDLAPYSTDQTLALDAMRQSSVVELPQTRPPWTKRDEADWKRRRAAVSPQPPARDDGGGSTTAANYDAPYYGLLSPAYAVAHGSSPFTQDLAMRLVSALLGALAAVFAALTLLELFPRRPEAAAAAGLLVGFQPMFGFMSGAVNNDMGVNAAAALLVYLIVRALRRGPTVVLGLAIGATLFALPLMKPSGNALVPAALLAIAGVMWRARGARPEALRFLASAAVAFLVLKVGWRSLTDILANPAAQPPGAGGGSAPALASGAFSSVLDHPTAYLSYTWQVFFPRLPFMQDLAPQPWPAFDIYVQRGWAAFGWYAISFPRWVYNVIVAAMLAVGALCAVAVWRERLAARRRGFELIVLILVAVGVLAAIEAAFYTTTGGRTVVSEQGRYVFPAIIPIAAVAVGGAYAFGRNRAAPILGGLVAAVLVISFAGQWLTLLGFYA